MRLKTGAKLLCPGELAQLVERCDRTAEVRGSNPLFSIGTYEIKVELEC